MLSISFTATFIKESKKLPASQQVRLAPLLALLQVNPYHSKLHTKKLKPPLSGQLSFRIGRDYRVLFMFNSPEILTVLRVKHRKDIYK